MAHRSTLSPDAAIDVLKQMNRDYNSGARVLERKQLALRSEKRARDLRELTENETRDRCLVERFQNSFSSCSTRSTYSTAARLPSPPLGPFNRGTTEPIASSIADRASYSVMEPDSPRTNIMSSVSPHFFDVNAENIERRIAFVDQKYELHSRLGRQWDREQASRYNTTAASLRRVKLALEHLAWTEDQVHRSQTTKGFAGPLTEQPIVETSQINSFFAEDYPADHADATPEQPSTDVALASMLQDMNPEIHADLTSDSFGDGHCSQPARASQEEADEAPRPVVPFSLRKEEVVVRELSSSPLPSSLVDSILRGNAAPRSQEPPEDNTPFAGAIVKSGKDERLCFPVDNEILGWEEPGSQIEFEHHLNQLMDEAKPFEDEDEGFWNEGIFLEEEPAPVLSSRPPLEVDVPVPDDPLAPSTHDVSTETEDLSHIVKDYDLSDPLSELEWVSADHLAISVSLDGEVSYVEDQSRPHTPLPPATDAVPHHENQRGSPNSYVEIFRRVQETLRIARKRRTQRQPQPIAGPSEAPNERSHSQWLPTEPQAVGAESFDYDPNSSYPECEVSLPPLPEREESEDESSVDDSAVLRHHEAGLLQARKSVWDQQQFKGHTKGNPVARFYKALPFKL